jgi:hypothetical protein
MFFDQIPPIKKELEKLGHIANFPNGYNTPELEEEMKQLEERKYKE